MNEYRLPLDVTFEQLRAALEDPAWQRRAAAQRLLVKFGDRVPLAWLEQGLIDPHKRVRVAAIEACASLAYCIPVALVSACLNDPEWSVRAAAAWALGHFQERTPFVRLRDIFDDLAEDDMVRASALHALAQAGGESQRELLIAACHDASWHVREMALLALDHVSHVPDALVEKMLHDEHPCPRAAALQVWHAPDERRELAVLLAALNDDEMVCHTAITRLSSLGTRAQAELVAMMAWMPPDAPPHRIVAEETTLFPNQEITAQQFLTLLPQAQAMAARYDYYPASLSDLSWDAILALRDLPLWNIYREALEHLLFSPQEPAQHVAKVYQSYLLLMGRLAVPQGVSGARASSSQVRRWCMAELEFRIADATALVRWAPQGPYTRRTETATLTRDDKDRVPISCTFHLVTWPEDHYRPCRLASIKLFSGYTTTPDEQWHTLLGGLQEYTGKSR
jgi:hypothetical protein